MRATFGLLLVLTAAMVPTAASASAASGMRTFVQMCGGCQTMSDARFEMLARRQYAEYASAYLPDVDVVDALRKALPNWSRVTIEERALEALPPSAQRMKAEFLKRLQVAYRRLVSSKRAQESIHALGPEIDRYEEGVT